MWSEHGVLTFLIPNTRQTDFARKPLNDSISHGRPWLIFFPEGLQGPRKEEKTGSPQCLAQKTALRKC